ncbi:hypothetical protein BH20ACT15_BH20ACT15_10450 [soil metagenome]
MIEDPESKDSEQEAGDEAERESSDDTPVPDEDSGEEGLGTESGASGGGESPPNNPDPSTKGATKGTEGAL